MRGSPLDDAVNGYANVSAYQVIQVCVYGRCKCKVDGAVDNIAIGDALAPHATGIARLVAIDVALGLGGGTAWNSAKAIAAFNQMASIFAKALYASTADADIIPVFVKTPLGVLT